MVFWAAERDWAMTAPPKMPRAPGGCQSSLLGLVGGVLLASSGWNDMLTVRW